VDLENFATASRRYTGDIHKLQTCIWPSRCYCHSLSLASVKSRLVLSFWYRLTQVVPDKGPINGCVCVGLIPTYYATMQIIPLHIHGSKEVCTPYTYPVMLELLTNSYSSLGTTLCYQLQLKKSVGRYTQTTMSSTGTIYCLTILNCT